MEVFFNIKGLDEKSKINEILTKVKFPIMLTKVDTSGESKTASDEITVWCETKEEASIIQAIVDTLTLPITITKITVTTCPGAADKIKIEDK
jgi:hypothetical protein